VKSISEVRTWISSPHSESDIKKKFAEALHKCAVIETSEMKPEFLNYNGFEYIAFENKNDLLLSQIKDKIKTIPKPISIKILPEKINFKSYTVLQFERPVESSENGFYLGNEEKAINHEHGFFISELNNKLI
jgi:hypothetical protein